jgi:hypothetical protein
MELARCLNSLGVVVVVVVVVVVAGVDGNVDGAEEEVEDIRNGRTTL